MTELERLRAGDRTVISEESLAHFLGRQRWVRDAHAVIGAELVWTAPLDGPDAPVIALAEAHMEVGTRELYQLVLGARAAGLGTGAARVEGFGHTEIYEAMSQPEYGAAIASAIAAAGDEPPQTGLVFATRGAEPPNGPGRAAGADQTNSSVIFDERQILKLFRRVQAGVNPELEILDFLTDHDFAHVPPLVGWYGHAGPPIDATLGVEQRYLPGAIDGWRLAVEAMRHGDPVFAGRLRRLGAVIGMLHRTLACEPNDARFAPEEHEPEALALMVARIDQLVDELYSGLPRREVLAPIAGREAEIRSRLRHLARPGNLGRRIRDHGDLHLGQALWWEDDWMVIDFEGEPARSLAERRVKRSPLRDVAGIFRSFAYAAAVGGDAARAGDPLDPWQQEAREAFLEGYLAEVGQAGLLPSSPAAIEELLALFELEKAVYEVRYEAAHRPDWLWIPVAGLSALLDRPGLS